MVRLARVLTLAALIILSVLFIDGHLIGVRADDAADCVKGRGNIQIQACSRIIKSGRVFGKPISMKALANTYNNRGVAYRKKHQYDRAIADYSKAINLNPKFANAYYNRGFIYDVKRQYDRAIADYSKAINLNPKDANTYNNRDFVYWNKRQNDRAIADYDKAISLNPKYVEAYNNRGFANISRAIADFRKSHALNPSDKVSKEILKRLGVTR